MSEATKPDKIRQLSIEHANAIEHLLQGQSDRVVSEAVGVSRQTVSEWKNHDPLFIAELNRQRSEMWREESPGQPCSGCGGGAAW
jgi:lipopolysaccharide biosynthesis regulator YciM